MYVHCVLQLMVCSVLEQIDDSKTVGDILQSVCAKMGKNYNKLI